MVGDGQSASMRAMPIKMVPGKVRGVRSSDVRILASASHAVPLARQASAPTTGPTIVESVAAAGLMIVVDLCIKMHINYYCSQDILQLCKMNDVKL
jgi:hypothetical protein